MTFASCSSMRGRIAAKSMPMPRQVRPQVPEPAREEGGGPPEVLVLEVVEPAREMDEALVEIPHRAALRLPDLLPHVVSLEEVPAVEQVDPSVEERARVHSCVHAAESIN